jgi:hypothetical protein
MAWWSVQRQFSIEAAREAGINEDVQVRRQTPSRKSTAYENVKSAHLPNTRRPANITRWSQRSPHELFSRVIRGRFTQPAML